MRETLLEMIGREYRLNEKDCGEYAGFSAAGMDFTNAHFDAEGFGSVSTMDAASPQGMAMNSVILNPFNVDAPLLSIDRISVMGTEMLYLEMFDSLLGENWDLTGPEAVADKYAALPDQPDSEHWYDDLRVGTPVLKKCTSAESGELDRLTEEYLAAYLEACKKAGSCDETEKRKKAAVYSEGLLEKGGPATDPVIAALGKDRCTEFFRKVLFATEKSEE